MATASASALRDRVVRAARAPAAAPAAPPRAHGARRAGQQRHRAGRDGDQLHDRVRAGVCGDVPRAYEVKVIARRSG